jgi:hypothetical protein
MSVTRGAFTPPTTPQRPTDAFSGAIFDAKNARTSTDQTIAAAKLNDLVKNDALRGNGGAELCKNIFRALAGADAGVINAYRDMVIGDSSYSIQNSAYTGQFINKLADAAKGQDNWPAGTNN